MIISKDNKVQFFLCLSNWYKNKTLSPSLSLSLSMCTCSISGISPSWARAGCKKTLCLLHYPRKIKFIHSFILSPPPHPPSLTVFPLSLSLSVFPLSHFPRHSPSLSLQPLLSLFVSNATALSIPPSPPPPSLSHLSESHLNHVVRKQIPSGKWK